MFAFTLAEVLITLVIIGVIAAITVPSLINKTNNQETVSRLKKAYSTLAQATNQIIAEEGPVPTWVTVDQNIYNLYKKKLLNAKECKGTQGCFIQGDIHDVVHHKVSNWAGKGLLALVLQDGTQVLFASNNNATVSSNCDLHENDIGSNNYCARMWVDVNGAKKPNAIGRDLFALVLKKDGLYPAGCDDKSKCKIEQNYGAACTCKVLREGAINY